MNIYKENKKVPSLVRMLVLKYICFIMCEKNFKKDYPCCDENKKSAINNMIKEKKSKLNEYFFVTQMFLKIIDF